MIPGFRHHQLVQTLLLVSRQGSPAYFKFLSTIAVLF